MFFLVDEFFAVAPDAFEVVKQPLFVVKNMNDYVPRVDYSPSALGNALGAAYFAAVFLDKLFDVFGKCFYLCGASRARDNKVIGYNRFVGDVNFNDIVRLFFA